MRRSVPLLAILALLGLATYLTTVRASALPGPLTVTYCRPGGQPLEMDLYAPAASGGPPARVVLYVHGGAWTSGSRRDTGDGWPQLVTRLRDAGLFAAAPDYRLASQAAWPAPLEDVTCAVRYLQAHSSGLHVDPAHIELYGTSAGGQVAAMAGLERLPGVDRVVDMYGPADLDAPGWSPWLRTDIKREFGSKVEAASPAAVASTAAPPFLVVQGDCDRIVPAAQSRELVARLRTRGVSVRYVEVHDAGHALGPCGGRTPAPTVETVRADVAGFLTG